MKHISCTVLTLASVAGLIPYIAYAETENFSIGAHANIVGGRGEPSNDVLGIGVIANYPVNDKWFMDIELIYSEADF